MLTSEALRCGDMYVEKECTSKPVEAAALKLGSVEYTGSKVAVYSSETTPRYGEEERAGSSASGGGTGSTGQSTYDAVLLREEGGSESGRGAGKFHQSP